MIDNTSYDISHLYEPGVLTYPFAFGAMAAGDIKTYDIDPSKTPSAAGYLTPIPDAIVVPATGGIRNGGTVILPAGLAAGHEVYIRRETPQTQDTVLQTQQQIHPKAVESSLDKLTMMEQEKDLGRIRQELQLIDGDITDIFNDMSQLSSALQSEAVARNDADANLQSQINQKANQSDLNAEASARAAADNSLHNRVDGKADKTYVDAQLANKADREHRHTQSEVDGLSSSLQAIGVALNGKASTALATQAVSGLMSATDKTKLDSLTPSGAPIATTTTPGLVKPDGVSVTVDPDGTLHAVGTGGGVTVHNALSGRDAADTHPLASITGLASALAGKAPTIHTHEMSQVNGLANALAAKANSADLNNYVSIATYAAGMGSKSDTGHTHTKGDITDLGMATPSVAGLMSNTDKVKLDGIPPGGGAYVGEIRLLSFRYTDLPTGWHYCNGGGYSTSSAVGQALAVLPAAFKSDWGITVSGTTIYLPNLFSGTDGYFLRPVNGSSRLPGSKQTGAMQGHRHNLSNSIFQTAYAMGPINLGGSAGTDYPKGTGSGAYDGIGVSSDPVISSYGAVPLAAENRPINIGMTPAIYLGVA